MTTERVQQLIRVDSIPHVMEVTIAREGRQPYGHPEIIRQATEEDLKNLPWNTYFTQGVVTLK